MIISHIIIETDNKSLSYHRV